MIKIKNKLKSLLPTLKEKKRYIVFEIISEQVIKANNSLSEQILAKIQEFIGIFGMAEAGVQIIKTKTNRGIIKVNHNYADKVKASLALIKTIDNQEVILNTLGTSGILKKAEERYL